MMSSEEKGRAIADLFIQWEMTALDPETIGQILVSAAEQYAADGQGFPRDNKRAAFEALARRAKAAAELLNWC